MFHQRVWPWRRESREDFQDINCWMRVKGHMFDCGLSLKKVYSNYWDMPPTGNVSFTTALSPMLTTFRALRNSGGDLTQTQVPVNKEFIDHLSNFSPKDTRAHPRVPRPCLLTGKRAGGTEEEVFLPPISDLGFLPFKGGDLVVSEVASASNKPPCTLVERS